MNDPNIQIALVLVALMGAAPGFALGWYQHKARCRRRYRHTY